MNNPLDAVIVFLIVSWAVGFFAFDVGNTMHAFLVFATIAVIIKVIQGKKTFRS